MLNGKNGAGPSCVIVDLNTQRDFFDVGGASPVLNVTGLFARLRRVVAWAKRNQVPIVSSMDCHRPAEANGPGVPRHCVEGTLGQSKLPFTLMPNRIYVAGDNTLSVSVDLFRQHQQVIFPLRSRDLFANPKADRFLTQLSADEFIVCGAIAEHEVKAVVLGLLIRNRSVTVVTDACGSWSQSELDLALRQISAKGAVLLTSEQLLARKLPRRWRYTHTGLVSAFRPNGDGPSNGSHAGNGSTNGRSARHGKNASA